mgnify:FL=1
MASLNIVILMGNLCADPELKKTPSGVSVCTFRLGVARQYKDADGNSVSDFVTCVAWRQTAEFVCRYFKKGASAVVQGALQTRNYTDQQGTKHTLYEVLANNVSFGTAKGSGASVPVPTDSDAPPVPGGETTAPAMPTFEPIGTDEDLPF